MKPLTATKTVAWAVWTERFNLGWRHSKYKPTLWKCLVQLAVAMFATVAYRELLAGASWWERGSVMLMYTILTALFTSLMTAPGLIFQRNHHTFPLLTSAPPLAVLHGLVLADVPQRTWVALLLAIPFTAGLPWLEKIAFAAGATLTGALVSGLTAWLAYTFLVLWVRVVPGGLVMFQVVSGIGQVGLLFALGYLLFHTSDLESLNLFALMGPIASTVLAVWAALVAVVMLWETAQQERMNRWYLNGWMAILEGKKSSANQKGSAWPHLLPGRVGAMMAKDLVLLTANPITKTRFALWAVFAAGGAVLIGTGLLPGWLERFSWFPDGRGVWFAVGAVLVPGCLAFGEVLAVVFQLDRRQETWYRIACVTPWQLLGAKLGVGMLTFVAPSVLLVIVYALLLGLPLVDTGLAVLHTLLLGSAGVALCIGIAAFDVKGGDAVSLKMEGKSEQLPQTPLAMLASFAGTGVFLFGLYAGSFERQEILADLLLWLVLWAVTAAVLAVGGRVLKGRLINPL